MKNKVFKIVLISLFALLSSVKTFAQSNNFPNGSTNGSTSMNRETRPVNIPNIDINITEPKTGSEVAFSVRLLIILTILTIAPTLLLLLTCFLRFSIVLDFIKRALSLQQVPPTAILNGIAFFMTLFVMWPTFNKIYTNAYKPMADGQIGIEVAYKEAEQPLRIFMAEQMDGNYDYIKLFMGIAKMDQPNDLSDVPTYVLIPAYILHELTIAFYIGIYLYIPFIIIDMVVASILMSMGMMMLPPVQISMPFKLMLFVLVDGWGLLIQSLFNSVL
ncbi:MAG: flagellar type III secretion system pore protein FliP [Treponema sp.]|nr:flagellar type III secretion system pore protein FliP [Candidatus Treponema scatequi]